MKCLGLGRQLPRLAIFAQPLLGTVHRGQLTPNAAHERHAHAAHARDRSIAQVRKLTQRHGDGIALVFICSAQSVLIVAAT
jgi:hypothetical protein